MTDNESHEALLERFERELWSVRPGEPRWEERCALLAQIEDYEKQHCQIHPPTPEEAAQFRQEQQGKPLNEKMSSFRRQFPRPLGGTCFEAVRMDPEGWTCLAPWVQTPEGAWWRPHVAGCHGWGWESQEWANHMAKVLNAAVGLTK